MHIVFKFVLGSLATWRLAFLLAREDGPWRVLARWREAMGSGFWGDLFSCVKCLGLWISIPLAFFVSEGGWLELIVVWLAISGVVALLDEWLRPPFEWQETEGNELLRGDSNSAAE